MRAIGAMMTETVAAIAAALAPIVMPRAYLAAALALWVPMRLAFLAWIGLERLYYALRRRYRRLIDLAIRQG